MLNARLGWSADRWSCGGRLGLVLLVGLAALLGAPRSFAAAVSITPIPASVSLGQGSVELKNGASIQTPTGDEAALGDAVWLQEALWRDRRLKLLTRQASALGAEPGIVFERKDVGLGQEGYRLTVSPEGVKIQAGTDQGLFYGAVSLLQLMTPEDGGQGAVSLQAVSVEDRPRYGWRGLMLDSVRHFQSVAFIKSLLDQMARYKLNVLHWHLTDDQGWRLEIKRYPLLTSKAAFRLEPGAAHLKDIDPNTGQPRLYGGYYTQDQARELVAYAKARGVTIVPEIEMPGHASAAIYAYPELGLRPVDPKTLGDWGVFPNLYKPSDATFSFLENVLAEVMEVFPSPYIHVGGDEAIKPFWRQSPEVQAEIKALGLKDEDALQSWFIQRIEIYLAAHGRRLIGWDEILQGGLPEGAVVMSWHGVTGAVAATKAGHDAILTPPLPFYLDNRQSDSANEPPGRGLIITLRSLYGYDPTPKGPAAGSGRILGLQANVWAEHIRLEDRWEHMAFPRAVALAEMAWSPPERRDWPDFISRLPADIRRDQAFGMSPALSAFEIREAEALNEKSHMVGVGLSDEASLGSIHYTLDGSAPSEASAVYGSPLSLSLPTTLRAAAFFEHQIVSPPFTKLIDEASVHTRDNHGLKLCTDALTLNLEAEAPINSDHRAVVLTDIKNPCWIWPGADLDPVVGVSAKVAPLPFNFQLGDEAKTLSLTPPQTPDGELDVHLDDCSGPLLAVMPLTPAIGHSALTTLQAKLAHSSGVHDLCFSFARASLDPMWVMDAVKLETRP